MKPSSSEARTSQDEIPPVHVLEAAQHQDRKETEDLLAGFDRPGRGPKPAPRERDFVGYYAKKKNAGVPSGPAAAVGGANRAAAPNAGPKQGDVATMVVPRKREGTPMWLAWAGAGVLMLMIGGAVAYFATTETTTHAAAPTGPSAATTITAGTPVPQNDRDMIPPPPPSTITAETTASATTTPMETTPSSTSLPAPKGSSKRDPKGASSNAASVSATTTSAAPRATGATGDGRPPPRDDFLRDF